MSYGPAVAAAAEELLGAPFKLHGRDVARGLDCVGLVSAVLARVGRSAPRPTGYSLRQSDVGVYLPLALAAGLSPASGAVEPGDVLLARAGPAQHHLLIASHGGGFIHAHAGLRRVVHSPAPLPWPILHHWRLQG